MVPGPHGSFLICFFHSLSSWLFSSLAQEFTSVCPSGWDQEQGQATATALSQEKGQATAMALEPEEGTGHSYGT